MVERALRRRALRPGPGYRLWAAIAALAGTCARRIAHVSSDPAPLARDVALFVRQSYPVEQVQPVDMFPQTYHIETVVLFRKAN